MGRHRSFLGERSPEKESWWAQSETRIARLERKIAEKGKRELAVLESAGLDRKRMLRLLALVADGEGDKSWARAMRAQQEALKSMAGRMETIARDAEKLVSDPFSSVRTWAFFVAHGGMLGMEPPKPLKDSVGVPLTVAGMRTLTKVWREEARSFGWFLRHYAHKRVNTDVPLLLLIVCGYLRQTEPSYWDELANLLKDAFEAAGKEKRVSADWLRKIWKERGRPMIYLLSKLKAEAPPDEGPTPQDLSPAGRMSLLGFLSENGSFQPSSSRNFKTSRFGPPS